MLRKWCSSCHNEFDVSKKEFHCPLKECFGMLYAPDDHMYKKTIGGIIVKGGFVKDTLEYAATPLWKHLGVKPNAEEAKLDNYLKRRGLSYSDYQKERLSKSKYKFDSTKLKKDLFAGKLKQKETPKYSKSSIPI